jgi:hypothetical protein
MNQKIKSMLQSSDKGSYYNYIIFGILGFFSAYLLHNYIYIPYYYN